MRWRAGWLWGEKLKLIFDWYKTRDELMAVADFAKIHRHLVQPGQHGPSELGDVLAKLGLHEASMLEEGTFFDAVESSKLRGTGTLLRPERQTLPRRQLRMISDGSHLGRQDMSMDEQWKSLGQTGHGHG